ncbi:beta-ketoacyl-[acyl-carrier-protein] synthase family protein [Cognatishimia activa]|uniref:beta-ketoacyl-[acyl-carrier-protein] synthase family protein n=1 Tax=Cognatishimia activa TaxID=1715691 RepID=UPI002231631A|nr:beta-ketoacyl-[acyl-carrier-protein] synthase family protein [Cognatishimia activa]UZD90336.1 beta-ketoacyl-[acyl-carrier-protein] synthase family protein [Cognatishimia activa]
MSRVAISGIGAVSAAGIGAEALWQLAVSGKSAVRAHDFPGNEILSVGIFGAFADFDPSEDEDAAILKRCDRYSQFAHLAAREAVTQSGIDPELLRGPRTAVFIGSGIGGMTTLDAGYNQLNSGRRFMDPLSVPKLIPSSATAHVSIQYGAQGPSFAVCSACSSASQSIGLAMMLIRAGVVDRAIAGGSEACLTVPTIRAWELLRVLSPDGCKPFSNNRNGTVLGEGAGVVLLESEASLAARGGAPIGWLNGYATTSDARDMLQPDVDGAAAAMQGALDDAGLSADDIDYINAHGTGTVLNDVNEATAIRRVFGDATDSLLVSSSKSQTGHLLGASGGIELAITLAAARAQIVPPHINCAEPDPKCEITLAADIPTNRPIRYALSNSFAFGGMNASLILAAPEV